ncbi:uncharacterized protein LOC133312697 [Gastrolobium bilobum]|uniref:uncharacterized protein LOC133312697 n=1 Tax=Gastrolobium bilobum TaxID=150636 RepID=UPI002AB12F95|nr:uncharacterized protein LOC133312697 [Gastrolobium bilobum]
MADSDSSAANDNTKAKLTSEAAIEPTLKPSDPRSPFFMPTSDSPGLFLTNVVLKGESNYDVWAKAFKNALLSKNKVGFIDGSITKPANDAFDETHAWTLCNSMINSWIHNTIDPLLKPYIHYFPTAKALWDDLRERYSIQNAPKIYQLKANLFQLRQQGISVSQYYTKLRGAWDELDDARALPDCPYGAHCPVTQHITKEMADDRVYQFLLGLDNAMFGTIRTQLLNQPNLPSLNKAYSTLVQEETQFHMAQTHETRTYVLSYAIRDIQKLPSSNADPVRCSHCGKLYHDVSKCYQLHGKPPYGRGRGRGKPYDKRNYTISSPAPQTAAAIPTFSNPNFVLNLTPEILQQIANMVVSPSTPSANTTTLSGKHIPNYTWLVDSGASQHMTGNLQLISNVESIPPTSIGLPDGDQLVSVQRGIFQLTSNIILQDVLYVPQLKCNLISVAQLLADTNCIISFTHTGCELQDPTTRIKIGLGRLQAGVYVHDSLNKRSSLTACTAQK